MLEQSTERPHPCCLTNTELPRCLGSAAPPALPAWKAPADPVGRRGYSPAFLPSSGSPARSGPVSHSPAASCIHRSTGCVSPPDLARSGGSSWFFHPTALWSSHRLSLATATQSRGVRRVDVKRRPCVGSGGRQGSSYRCRCSSTLPIGNRPAARSGYRSTRCHRVVNPCRTFFTGEAGLLILRACGIRWLQGLAKIKSASLRSLVT